MKIAGTKNTDAGWAAVRAERDRLLGSCDWTQMPDNPLSEALRASWATYRQALRTELEAAGIAADDALVHLVFAAVDGLVFQQVCLDEPAAAQAGVERLRGLLRPLAR